MPGQEVHRKLADAFEGVGEESDDTDEGVDDHDDVGQLRAAPFTEARLDPLGAGHHVGTAQPGRKKHHQEHLVEGRPEPGNPDALYAVNEHPADQQHGAADVEHARGVGDSKDVPGHGVAAQKVGLHVTGRAVRNPVAHEDRRKQVSDDNRNVKRMKIHETRSLRVAGEAHTTMRASLPNYIREAHLELKLSRGHTIVAVLGASLYSPFAALVRSNPRCAIGKWEWPFFHRKTRS